MDNATAGLAPKSYEPEILRHIARMDLDVHKENKRRYGDERPYLRYAFAAEHVRRAEGSVARLLKLAIEQPHLGMDSHFCERRQLYRLREGLRAALAQERNTTYEHIELSRTITIRPPTVGLQTSDTTAGGRSRRRLRLTCG